jgi:predicted PilT family ATPase
VNFYTGSEYLFSATAGKNSQIRVAKNSDVGKDVMHALLRNELKIFS